MTATVRLAAGGDASQWLEILKASTEVQLPGKDIASLAWVASELNSANGHETWIAEREGSVQAAISFLKPVDANTNPVQSLGRSFFRRESHQNGSAEALLHRVKQVGLERKQMMVAHVAAADNSQQILYENLGYVCVGYQPAKHVVGTRRGILYYLLPANPVLVTRLPLSDSLSQVSELATLVLERIQVPTTLSVRDGVTGYPLDSDLAIHEAIFEDFELCRAQVQAASPALEVSSGFNRGAGLLRMNSPTPARALLGQRDSKVISGLVYFHDEQDQCVRIFDAFASDYLSVGPLLARAVKIAQEQLSASYIEIDILMHARRLLKSAEQLGFVPVAYLPAFSSCRGHFADVVKMVKLDLAYVPEEIALTPQATAVVKLIDSSFRDLKAGIAIINLLRSLPIFTGLGDGELRKFAHLFSQKLYRENEPIFKKGDAGDEAYVVLRGQVDILLDENSTPIASLKSGEIFGELAFLDGASRGASAIAAQASILLVVQRSAFHELVQTEPHLGMMVLHNIAVDLSNKLRRTTHAKCLTA